VPELHGRCYADDTQDYDLGTRLDGVGLDVCAAQRRGSTHIQPHNPDQVVFEDNFEDNGGLET